MGRRIEKNVDGTITRYLYSNEGLIAEYDINNNLKKSYGWMPNGIWGTDPLYMTENSQTYFYHNDALGTPQKMTDANGNVVWSANYTAFGEATIDPSSTITNNLRFAGQYFDQETGINYNLFRVYDPKTGTYISKDPISFAAGDVNLYRYVGNNPVNFIDPYGLNRIMFGPNIASKDEYEDGLKALGLGNLPEWLKNSLYKLYIGSEEAAIMPGVGAIETGSSKFTGMAVKEILKFKKGSILNCPLKKGTPGWDKIIDMKWEELVKLAEKNQGVKTILKLLRDRRFDK